MHNRFLAVFLLLNFALWQRHFQVCARVLSQITLAAARVPVSLADNIATKKRSARWKIK